MNCNETKWIIWYKLVKDFTWLTEWIQCFSLRKCGNSNLQQRQNMNTILPDLMSWTLQCFLRKENSVSFKFTTPAKHESIVSRLDVSGAHSFPKGIAIISLNYLILQRYDDVMWQHEGVTLSDRIVQQKEMKSYN